MLNPMNTTDQQDIFFDDACLPNTEPGSGLFLVLPSMASPTTLERLPIRGCPAVKSKLDKPLKLGGLINTLLRVSHADSRNNAAVEQPLANVTL
jgi:hypothetical protein